MEDDDLNPLQNMRPVASCERLESKEALQSKLSVLCILHTSAGVQDTRCYSHTPRDLSFSSGILAGYDSIAQFGGYWDEIEGGSSANHYDAGDSHGIKAIETIIPALPVVKLECRYSPCNDLRLCVSPFDEGFSFDEY